MPWVSKKQQAWGNSPAGHKALGDKGVKEWNNASGNLPMRHCSSCKPKSHKMNTK